MEKNLRYTGPDGNSILDAVNKMERLYQVPLSYFEGLADEIMAKIRLGAFSGNLGYQVPAGYFSGLADQIMSRIQSEENSATSPKNDFRDAAVYQELAEVAPLLLQISNQNVYEVPKGYFESLTSDQAMRSDDMIQTTVTEKDTNGKVIPMRSSKSIWRTAVAAAAIVVVLFSGERYFTNYHNNTVPQATSNQFASKINTNSDSFFTGISTLSDEEIMGYLSTPDPTLRDSMSDKAAEETQKAISSMTNEELENYLERTPATY